MFKVLVGQIHVVVEMMAEEEYAVSRHGTIVPKPQLCHPGVDIGSYKSTNSDRIDFSIQSL